VEVPLRASFDGERSATTPGSEDGLGQETVGTEGDSE